MRLLCVTGLFLLLVGCGPSEAELNKKASVDQVQAIEDAAGKNAAALAEVTQELQAVQEQVSRIREQTDALDVPTDDDTLKILHAIAHNDQLSNDLRRYAFMDLAKRRGGLQVIAQFITTKPGNIAAASAISVLQREFSSHPSYEEIMREVAEMALTDLTAEESKRAAANKQTAQRVMFSFSPQEYVDVFLDGALSTIKRSKYDPSNAQELFEQVKESVHYSDRAKSREYVEAMINMYGEGFGSSETRAGHACLVALTGQDLGSNSSSSTKRRETTAAYRKWHTEAFAAKEPEGAEAQ